MLDTVLINGDYAIFDPLFKGGLITGPIMPGKIRGSGKATVKKKKICVKGDEDSVVVRNCPYIAGSYVIPGIGTFTIKKLNANQISKKTKLAKKGVLLKGSWFQAEFTVNTPAQQPNPPAPNLLDQVGKKYIGSGRFQSFNTNYKTK